jgi:hypothetical protein
MAGTDALDITPIDAEQSEAVAPLSVEAGWNQTVTDWRFMLAAGQGFGCRGTDGRWEASSLVLPLGQKLAWISMVLVTATRRRGGVGTGLLRRCIEEVRVSGAVPGLDATEQGRPIYLPLGFHDLYGISRWQLDRRPGLEPVAPPPGIIIRPFAIADLPRLAIYDRPLSAMERPTILAHLAMRQPGLAWVAETHSGRIAGFGLGREGRAASSIGPVIADSEAVTVALISRVTHVASGPFILDVPDCHRELRRWLERSGAVTPRAYTRMTLGEAKGLDDARHVFALAGPELG